MPARSGVLAQVKEALLRFPAPPVPPDASVFRFPVVLRVQVAGYAIIGLVVLVYSRRTLAAGPTHVPLALYTLVIASLGTLAALFILGFMRYRASVAVNSEGLWYVAGKSEPTFIPWRDVSFVEGREMVQGPMLVHARDGAKIRLSSQLEKFGQLKDYVLSHASTTGTPPASAP